MNTQEEKQRLIDLTLKVEKPPHFDNWLKCATGQKAGNWLAEEECKTYYKALHQAKQTALIIAKEIKRNAESMDDKWHDNEDAPLTSVFIYEVEFYDEIINDLQKELE